MSLLDLTSSLEHTALEPSALPGFPFGSSGQAATSGRVLLSGRVLRAIRAFRQLCVGTLLTPKSRRLRVNETVSLGDKRFVSIVAVDGVDYLIGGGAASVALLTRLGPTGAPRTFEDAVADAREEAQTA